MKKKIVLKTVLTVLLGLTIAACIYGAISLILQTPYNAYQVERNAADRLTVDFIKKYVVGLHHETIFKAILCFLAVAFSVFMIIAIWSDFFTIKSFTYEEYEKYRLERKAEKKEKLQRKNDKLQQKIDKLN